MCKEWLDITYKSVRYLFMRLDNETINFISEACLQVTVYTKFVSTLANYFTCTAFSCNIQLFSHFCLTSFHFFFPQNFSCFEIKFCLFNLDSGLIYLHRKFYFVCRLSNCRCYVFLLLINVVIPNCSEWVVCTADQQEILHSIINLHSCHKELRTFRNR